MVNLIAITGARKMQDRKMQDWKMTDQINQTLVNTSIG